MVLFFVLVIWFTYAAHGRTPTSISISVMITVFLFHCYESICAFTRLGLTSDMLVIVD